MKRSRRLMLVTLVVMLCMLANPAIWCVLIKPAICREMSLSFQCMVGSPTLFECAAIEYMARHQVGSTPTAVSHHVDVFPKVKRYVVTVLLMTDEWFNALFGGYAEETISYRLAVNASKGGIVGRTGCKLIQSVVPNDCTRTRWLQSELVRPR